MQENYQTLYKNLPSGLKIVFRPSCSEVAYVGIMVGCGTRDEQPEENGLAHYIEHCVFKGALSPEGRVLSSRDIINRVERCGGEINAYTTKEETTYYAATPRREWRKTLELLTDMILRPTFPKTETDKEVSVILDEIESYEDSPSELIYDDFESLVFHGHPLSQPILGTRKSVRAISRRRETALRFMARHYRQDRMVVFAQGQLDFRALCQHVEHLFSAEAVYANLCEDVSESGRHAYIGNESPSDLSLKRRTHQTHLMLGGTAYPIGHRHHLTLYLLNNLLGGGAMSSRLNLNIREKHGLVYTIESQYTPLSDTGYWSIYFASEAHHRDRCLELTLRELNKLREKPLTTSQLTRALNQLHGQMAISAENQENSVLSMAKQTLYYGFSPTWQDTFQKISTITREDIFQVANETYHSDNISKLIYA